MGKCFSNKRSVQEAERKATSSFIPSVGGDVGGAALLAAKADFGTEQRAILVGLDDAGKTSICYRMKYGVFIPHAQPTATYNVETFVHNEPGPTDKAKVGRAMKLTLWDLGGLPQARGEMIFFVFYVTRHMTEYSIKFNVLFLYFSFCCMTQYSSFKCYY